MSTWFGGKQQEEEGCIEKIIFNATIKECLYVINDYEKYSEFLDAIKQTKITKTSKDKKQTHVWYKVSAAFTTIEYTLILTKTENPIGLTWKETKGGPFKYMGGGWILKDLGGGKVEGSYTVKCQFNYWLPSFLKNYLVGSSLPATLKAFKKRIENKK